MIIIGVRLRTHLRDGRTAAVAAAAAAPMMMTATAAAAVAAAVPVTAEAIARTRRRRRGIAKTECVELPNDNDGPTTRSDTTVFTSG